MYTKEFAAYKEAVVAAYYQKKETGQEGWLIRPTRARLRHACIQLAESGLKGEDASMLRGYLEMDEGENDCLQTLKKKDADDFKGFEDFLKNTGKLSHEKNIELLAWLIDYPFRPITRFKKVVYSNSDQKEIIKEVEEKIPELGEGQKAEEKDTKGTEGPIQNAVPLIWYWLSGAAVILIIAIVLWTSGKKDKQCMYWDDDHYVAADCNTPKSDTALIKLDPVKLAGFKRIGKVDTVSRNSIGKLWYVRINGKIELFTADGTHPLHSDKKLAELNDYVINVCRNQHDD